jgi:hypothetical protein
MVLTGLEMTGAKRPVAAESGALSAGWWLASENRQLSVESTLEGGPRFATGDIGGEVRIFV